MLVEKAISTIRKLDLTTTKSCAKQNESSFSWPPEELIRQSDPTQMSENFKLHKLLANVQDGSIIGVQAVLSDGTKSPVFGEGACKIESDTLSSHGASEISIK